MRDRYLFSADRTSSEYRTVLEITPGHARLLTPSMSARNWKWVISMIYYVLYTGVFGSVFALAVTWAAGAALPSWAAFLAFGFTWITGLLIVFFWWDRRSLPLLADNPSHATEVILLGARSFGTFQEVRARTMRGEDMQLVVDSRPPRFWEAVQLLEGRTPAPA